MIKKFKATITSAKYVEKQIQNILDNNIIYEAQKAVLSKTLDDKDKKENAVKAITLLDVKMKSGEEQLKLWEEYYNELK